MPLETLPPIDREVARKLMEIESLPTLPAVMHQLLECVQDEDTSAEDVTALVERDVAMSARILRLANSAFFGLRHKVDTVRRAVVVVGFDTVRMLALAMSVFDALGRHQPLALDPEEFWLHSLGSGKAAQWLAAEVSGVESAGSCFTAGLLHDVGKYFLALALKEEYVRVVACARETCQNMQRVESGMIGMTHADASWWMAKKWSLPANISDALGFQGRSEVYQGCHWREVAIVELASDIARAAQFGLAADYAPVEFPGTAGERLGLTQARIADGIAHLSGYEDEAKQFLETLRNP